MKSETAGMKETATAQWTTPAVMPNSTAVMLAHWGALCVLSQNVLVSIKQVNQTHYKQTSQLHDVI